MCAGGSGDGYRVDVVAPEQTVEVVDESHSDSVGCCLSPGTIIVPDGDQLGVRVLLDPPGVLGCMHVPESENRHRDGFRHVESFLEH
jgi:hypothetical protein